MEHNTSSESPPAGSRADGSGEDAGTAVRDAQPRWGWEEGMMAGSYRILRIIGVRQTRSGNKVDERDLYVGRHFKTGQQVFIKRQRKEGSEEHARDRLRHEWYMYEALHHDDAMNRWEYQGIARPLELFEIVVDTGKMQCLVLPYVGSRTLKDVRLPEELVTVSVGIARTPSHLTAHIT